MANLLKGYSSLTLFKPVIRPHPWPFSHDTRGVMVMGSGEKSVKHGFHLHLPHLHHHNNHHGSSKKQVRDVPKGCLAIKVGQGEEQQRFVVPVIYFNHPLFMQLLKEAEEEYGFDQKGTITIPCHVEEFRYVQGMIDRENSLHQHHQHHNHIVGCFRV